MVGRGTLLVLPLAAAGVASARFEHVPLRSRLLLRFRRQALAAQGPAVLADHGQHGGGHHQRAGVLLVAEVDRHLRAPVFGVVPVAVVDGLTRRAFRVVTGRRRLHLGRRKPSLAIDRRAARVARELAEARGEHEVALVALHAHGVGARLAADAAGEVAAGVLPRVLGKRCSLAAALQRMPGWFTSALVMMVN